MLRTVEHDGQQWRLKWNPQGRTSGVGRGLERKITISCSPESGPVQHIEIYTDEIANGVLFCLLMRFCGRFGKRNRLDAVSRPGRRREKRRNRIADQMVGDGKHRLENQSSGTRNIKPHRCR